MHNWLFIFFWYCSFAGCRQVHCGRYWGSPTKYWTISKATKHYRGAVNEGIGARFSSCSAATHALLKFLFFTFSACCWWRRLMLPNSGNLKKHWNGFGFSSSRFCPVIGVRIGIPLRPSGNAIITYLTMSHWSNKNKVDSVAAVWNFESQPWAVTLKLCLWVACTVHKTPSVAFWLTVYGSQHQC